VSGEPETGTSGLGRFTLAMFAGFCAGLIGLGFAGGCLLC
jgi:hypothetical protein